MIRTILVPTDGSSHAEKAVSLAGELAKALDAKVVVLHALQDTIHENIPEAYREFANAEHIQIGDVLNSVGEEILERAAAQLRTQGVDIIAFAVPRAPAAPAILNYAKEHPIDLIVMGCRGLSSLEGLMFGSVSHTVNHLASCNCLIVR